MTADQFSSGNYAEILFPMMQQLTEDPANECSALPDFVNDSTFPDMISIVSTDTMTIDPASYLTAVLSPCSGMRPVPTIIAVSETSDPTAGAKIVSINPTTFIMDVDPTTHSGGDFTGLTNRVFRFEV